MYIKANLSPQLNEAIQLINSYLSQITQNQFIDQLILEILERS